MYAIKCPPLGIIKSNRNQCSITCELQWYVWKYFLRNAIFQSREHGNGLHLCNWYYVTFDCCIWTKTSLIMTVSLQMSLECVVNAILFAIMYGFVIIFDNRLIIDQHCFYVFLLMRLNSIKFPHMKWREERVVMFGSRVFWNVRHLVECNINVIVCLVPLSRPAWL